MIANIPPASIPTNRAIGHAYSDSYYAKQFGRPEAGCWFHYTLDADYDAANEIGPFDTATEADVASRAAHPTMTLPPGIADWLGEFLVIDQGDTAARDGASG